MRISSKNAICLSVVGFLTVLTAICGTGEVAQASTFYVDSTADTVDATPGDGVCDDGAGSCSLRAAIMEANALVGADIIDAPAGTYTLTIPGERENAALTGDLDITDELTITGAGESSTIIDGGGIDRVLEVIAAGNIADITIQNSAGSFEEAAGAGIYNTSQQLTLNNVTIIGNQTGIYNSFEASTILADTSVIGNSPGSGIVNYGTVEIRNAAIQGNTSYDWGGGIKNLGTMTYSADGC
jgi:CSLREA domain-containing protein